MFESRDDHPILHPEMRQFLELFDIQMRRIRTVAVQEERAGCTSADLTADIRLACDILQAYNNLWLQMPAD